jgi:hypothetical protein
MDSTVVKYQGLIDLILTTEDVSKLGEEIDILLKGLYHVESGEFEQKLREEVRLRVAGEIRRLLGGSVVQGEKEIKAVLSSAYSTVCALPILKLILAFEPSEVVINDISHWARVNLERGILIDLSMDRNLLGGAVIIYKGKFYDFSVRKKLHEIFEKGILTL